MKTATDQPRPAFGSIPVTLGTAQARWSRIQSLRQAADRYLSLLPLHVGPGSRLPGTCREVWGACEQEALICILHRDYQGAEVALDRGVHSLRHALDLLRQARLSEDVILSLLAAA